MAHPLVQFFRESAFDWLNMRKLGSEPTLLR